MNATEETIEAPAEALAVIVYRDQSEALADTHKVLTAIHDGVVVAPSGVLAEVQAGALIRSEESAAVLAEARSLTVATPADYLEALEIVKRAKLAGKGADEERTSYTAVINPVVKWINDRYRQAIADAIGKDTGAAAIAWAKAEAYDKEQTRIAAEAARKVREENDRREKKLREEAAEAQRIADKARQDEQDALDAAEAARVAGDAEAAAVADKAAKDAAALATRKEAVFERRQDAADQTAAAPAYIPPSTAGALKGTGISKGRPLPQWAFDGTDEAACLLKIVKAAAEGSAAALMCLMVDPAGAKKQAAAKATVPGLRLWSGTSAPGVRV